MAGGTGNDLQIGGPGNDTIFANLGQDVTQGGDGNDDLWALARGDVTPGPGGAVDQVGDTLDGGAATTPSTPATARSTASSAAPASTRRCSTRST